MTTQFLFLSRRFYWAFTSLTAIFPHHMTNNSQLFSGFHSAINKSLFSVIAVHFFFGKQFLFSLCSLLELLFCVCSEFCNEGIKGGFLFFVLPGIQQAFWISAGIFISSVKFYFTATISSDTACSPFYYLLLELQLNSG